MKSMKKIKQLKLKSKERQLKKENFVINYDSDDYNGYSINVEHLEILSPSTIELVILEEEEQLDSISSPFLIQSPDTQEVEVKRPFRKSDVTRSEVRGKKKSSSSTSSVTCASFGSPKVPTVPTPPPRRKSFTRRNSQEQPFRSEEPLSPEVVPKVPSRKHRRSLSGRQENESPFEVSKEEDNNNLLLSLPLNTPCHESSSTTVTSTTHHSHNLRTSKTRNLVNPPFKSDSRHHFDTLRFKDNLDSYQVEEKKKGPSTTTTTSLEVPNLVLVTLEKVDGKGLGLKLCSGKGSEEEGDTLIKRSASGVYVSSIIPGSSAESSGQIAKGDEIIEINGVSLNEMSYVEAIGLLKNSPIKSNLIVKKNQLDSPLMNNSSNNLIINDSSYSTPTISKSSLITNNNNNKMVMARKQLFPDEPINIPSITSPCDILKYSNEGNTFTVTLFKNMRGLGLSIIGGVDVNTCYSHNSNNNNSLSSQSSLQQLPMSQSQQSVNSQLISSSSLNSTSSLIVPSPIDKLIRIKRVFPSDPAANAGLIPGDIILEANGTSTIGMTQVEAVNLLHSLSNQVTLKVMRVKFNNNNQVTSSVVNTNNSNNCHVLTSSPSSGVTKVKISSSTEDNLTNQDMDISTMDIEDEEDNLIKQLESSTTINEDDEDNLMNQEELKLNQLITCYDVTLTKKDGSLGFTILKKEDGGLFVKEVIKEPAINEPLITPGDKILLVNGIDVSSLSHSGAISYLRGLPNVVTLKLEPQFNEDLIKDCIIVGSIDGRSSRTESTTGLSQSSSGRRNVKQLRHEARMMIKEKSSNCINGSGSNCDSLSRLKQKRKNQQKTRQLTQPINYKVNEEENQVNDDNLSSSNYSTLNRSDYEEAEDDDQKQKSDAKDCHETLTAKDDLNKHKIVIINSSADQKITINNNSSDEMNLKDDQEEAKDDLTSKRQTLVHNVSADQLLSSAAKDASFDDETSSASFAKWRGTNLVNNELNHDNNNWDNIGHHESEEEVIVGAVGGHYNGQRTSDEADSGFGGDWTPKTTLEKPLTTQDMEAINELMNESSSNETINIINEPKDATDNLITETKPTIIATKSTDSVEEEVIEVILDKGWTSRLGIILKDDDQEKDSLINPTGCVVKDIFPNTVASSDGRIKPGYKLINVNDVNVKGKSAKFVIDLLRKMRGKIKMNLIVPSTGNNDEGSPV